MRSRPGRAKSYAAGASHGERVDTLSRMQDEEAGSGQDTNGLEGALARVERALEASSKAVAALARELKRAHAAAASGQVRELRRALDAGQAMAGDVVERVGAAATAYDVDEVDLLTSGAYAKELLAAAEAADVAMFAEDDRLLCYPSIVRVLPGDLALEIDRKRARGIRPSVVVAQLARAQRAGPRFKPAPFLASLVGAYDLVVAGQGKPPGAVVRVLEVYNALTLLPGQSRDYTRAEFARDLYLLDQSGETAGPGGRALRWAASSGTRQTGVLTTVAMSGQQQRYWGIAVESGRSEEDAG